MLQLNKRLHFLRHHLGYELVAKTSTPLKNSFGKKHQCVALRSVAPQEAIRPLKEEGKNLRKLDVFMSKTNFSNPHYFTSKLKNIARSQMASSNTSHRL